jgi:hypothetical protein
MKLNCKDCGSEVTANNINLDRMIAKCNICNAVFSFATHLGHNNFYSPTAQKPKVERPKSMTVSALATELKISRKWFSPIFYHLAFFALIWNFPVFGVAVAILLSGELATLPFLSLHLLAGLGITYMALTLLLNSTEITVNRNQLSIWHGPLPMKKNLIVSANEIAQIYCKEKIRHGQTATLTYELYALNRNHQRQELVTDLPSAEDAIFLEQEIERFLRIQDQPIRGEYLP